MTSPRPGGTDRRYGVELNWQGWVGELLDRVLIISEQHLRAVLTEYQSHYNTARPHQGIAQRVPDDEPDDPRLIGTDLDIQHIRRRPALNGLINEYMHAA